MRRCEECGATNPASAQWCGQCYASLGGAAGEASAAGSPAGEAARVAGAAGPTGEAAATAGEASVAGEAPAAGVAEAVRGAGAAFRRRGGEVEWACVACGTYNPLAASSCAACATPLAAAFDGGGAAGRAADPRLVLAASLLLPGSGHVLSGQAASGVARAVLYLVWLGGGLLLAAAGGTLLVTGPLLLGALVVWAGSLADLAGERRSAPPLLGARVLLWLVVGVTLLSLLGLAAGVAGQQASGAAGAAGAGWPA